MEEDAVRAVQIRGSSRKGALDVCRVDETGCQVAALADELSDSGRVDVAREADGLAGFLHVF